MKKLLIIGYSYPPIASMGAVRLASFVRNLPKFGWQPYVVTVRPGKWVFSNAQVPVDEDPAMVCRTSCIDIRKIIPKVFGTIFRAGGVTRSQAAKEKGLPILRSGISIYDSLLAFPDPTWPWYFIGHREALRFASKVQPDVILSSSGPFMSHMMAAKISKNLEVPWVADYRDLWSGDLHTPYSPLNRSARQWLEGRVLRRASALCTVSELFAESLRAMHQKNVFVVMNGFDPAPVTTEAAPFENFTVLFTGMNYPGTRDPSLLFDAVRVLREEGRAPHGMRIVFYGPNHDVTHRMAVDAQVEEFVECHGAVPRGEALAMQARAHLLLVLDYNDAKPSGVFPGKFFEYLGAGRPMLAISSKNGAMDAVMQATGVGRVASSLSEIKEVISNAYDAYTRGSPVLPDRKPQEIAKYTRENQAQALAGHLSALPLSRVRRDDFLQQS